MDVYHNSVCVNHNLVYRFRNAHCIRRLILIRIVTPLTSEGILMTMHILSYTIKASMHTCFAFNSPQEFNSLISFQSSQILIGLVQFIFQLNLGNKLPKGKIALGFKLYKN